MKYHLSFDIDFNRNPYKGKFIAIEGIDGSGKTTQVERLKEILSKSRTNLFFTKNPTDGEIGKFIRQMLTGKIKFVPIAYQYLFCADRATQQEEIVKHLKKGDTVITDRYFWSSVAYGGLDRGIDFSQEKESLKKGNLALCAFSILSAYNEFLVPDITLFLKISAKSAIERLTSSRHVKDIYDEKDKLEKITNGYEWLIKKFPDEFTIIDGEQSVEKVTDNIIAKI